MGFFDRIVTIVKGNINEMIDKAEDPEKMLDQLIRDMQQQYTEAKERVALAIADEKKLERLYQEQLSLRDDWTKKAELAVSRQNDELALQALKRKGEYASLATSYEEQLQGQQEATGKLKDALRQLNDKIEEAKRKKELLIARSKRAKAQETINKTYSDMNGSNSFDAFERMENKVKAIEDRAKAKEEINEHVTGDSLAKEFEKLEKGSADQNALDELAMLKSKMSKAE